MRKLIIALALIVSLATVANAEIIQVIKSSVSTTVIHEDGRVTTVYGDVDPVIIVNTGENRNGTNDE